MHHLFYRRKELTEAEAGKLCLKCQFCCRFLLSSMSENEKETEQIALMKDWGIPILSNGATFYTLSSLACQQITGAGCKIYEERNIACRNFKGGDSAIEFRPFCLWYEPVDEDSKAKMLRDGIVQRGGKCTTYSTAGRG